MQKPHRKIEYSVAVASFVAAVVFAFASLLVTEDHEVAAGNLMVIAQFLLLTASIFGLDYKLGTLGSTRPGSLNVSPAPDGLPIGQTPENQ